MGHDSPPCGPALPVAGVEVVGRSISLFVPKLGTWNEGTVDMYDPTLLQHRVRHLPCWPKHRSHLASMRV